MHVSALWSYGACAIAWACFASPALAVTPLDSVSASPDVTVELVSTTFEDEDVAVDNLLGIVVPTALGTLPTSADLTAYHLFDGGAQLFSLDTTALLTGPLTVEPGDVVRYDGAIYTVEFDASANALPNGVGVDAVTEVGGTDLLLSFDTTVNLGSFTAGDEDLVRCTLPSAGVCTGFGSTPYFDGSDTTAVPPDGVPDGLDLDAAHRLSNGNLGLSFDGSGQLGGVDFDDEDVLEYDPSGPTWEMAYDGSAEHTDWGGGPDVDAVFLPEPDRLLMLASGVGALLALKRRRSRNPLVE
jgi:hypothetical protein